MKRINELIYTGEDSEDDDEEFSISAEEFLKIKRKEIDKALAEQEIYENGWKETLPPEH